MPSFEIFGLGPYPFGLGPYLCIASPNIGSNWAISGGRYHAIFEIFLTQYRSLTAYWA